MKYIEITCICAHMHTYVHAYTHIRARAFHRSHVHITKNTRKGIHEMTTNDIMILAIMAAWLMFLKWIMR